MRVLVCFHPCMSVYSHVFLSDMGSASSVPSDSFLGKIMADWSTYSYEPKTKKNEILL